MCLAVPGKLIEVSGEGVERSGRVDFGGMVRNVSLLCTPEAMTGQYLLVHAGLAITTIDEAQAQQTLALLSELDDDAAH